MLQPREVEGHRDRGFGRCRRVTQAKAQSHVAQAQVVLRRGGDGQLGDRGDGGVGRRLIDGHVRHDVGGRFDFVARRLGVLDPLGVLELKRVAVRPRLGDHEAAVKFPRVARDGDRAGRLVLHPQRCSGERLARAGAKRDLRADGAPHLAVAGRQRFDRPRCVGRRREHDFQTFDDRRQHDLHFGLGQTVVVSAHHAEPDRTSIGGQAQQANVMRHSGRVAKRCVPQRLAHFGVVGEPILEKDVIGQAAFAVLDQKIELAAADDFEGGGGFRVERSKLRRQVKQVGVTRPRAGRIRQEEPFGREQGFGRREAD